ncbi:MAG: excinuclease ABC subunit UvrB, partial [Pseudomonadota bacterium]
EAQINEQIDRMRHSATRALLERNDVIIVASVSCIYGIGSVETYSNMVLALSPGQQVSRNDLLNRLVDLQYTRNNIAFGRGTFRAQGDTVEIFPAHLDDRAWRVSMFGDEIEKITEFDPLTGQKTQTLNGVKVYANSHYVTPRPTVNQALEQIKVDLKTRIEEFTAEGKLLEAQRIEQRTQFDIEMLMATGSCQGIENYSRYLSGRAVGEPPPTLFEYLPKNALLIVDESHVTVPQIGGMYKGDFARNSTLSDYGFRLPACKDNRPLKFEEWEVMRPQTVFVSATPGPWELEQTGGVFTEQVVRPTGLIDPPVIVRPTENQVDDLLAEIRLCLEKEQRVLVTTLTKKMAEALTEYMTEAGIKVRYIHSDVDTLERIEIIRDLRLGTFDVLVGINLLREGLDIPECGMVAILDADKEGYLRSKTSLIQTIGRAARNVEGKAVLYADKVTDSMQFAIDETDRRRKKQVEYNEKMGITPQTVKKEIADLMADAYGQQGDTPMLEAADGTQAAFKPQDMKAKIAEIEEKMRAAAADLEFEEAARLRDELRRLEAADLGFADGDMTNPRLAPGWSKRSSAPTKPKNKRRRRRS